MPISGITLKYTNFSSSETKETKSGSSTIQPSLSATTNRRDATSINSLAEKAKSALTEIADLRIKQYELAYSSNSASDQKKVDYEAEIATIQTEIERVAEEATYNGEDALQGGTYSVSISENNYNRVVSLANNTVVTTDYSIDLSTETNRNSAITDLVYAKENIENAVSNANGAVNQSSEILSDISITADSTVTDNSRSNLTTIQSITSAYAAKVTSEESTDTELPELNLNISI